MARLRSTNFTMARAAALMAVLLAPPLAAVAQSEFSKGDLVGGVPPNLAGTNHSFGPSLATVPAVDPASFVTPDQCWRGWLAENHMLEGANRKDNGGIIFVVQASDIVQVPPNSPSWVTARNALAGQLHLKAIAKISRFIRQKVGGLASADWLKAGDTPAPLIKTVAEKISLAERARLLAGLKLDAEIRKFDPKWRGDGKTDAQKRKVAVALSLRYREGGQGQFGVAGGWCHNGDPVRGAGA